MRKHFILIFIICCLTTYIGTAQQDAMFTGYMFNTLVFNPAYAGSNDHLSLGVLHRSQWVGVEGAPTSQTLTAHTPLKNDRVGVGLSLINDKIGPTSSIGANLSYAYRIPLGKKGGHLAIGLQAGATSWRANYSQLQLDRSDDPAFSDSPNFILPNVGAGIYYSTKYAYIGAGFPRIIEYDLRDKAKIKTPIYAKLYRHAFFHTGLAIPLKGEDLVFKPSVIVRNVGLFSSLYKDKAFQSVGAPTSFDVDMSLFFYQTLWLGAAYRSAIEAFDGRSSFDSADVWLAYYLKNGLRIGAAYDYTLTKIQRATPGSFEVFLGYEFDYKTKRVVTPRYF